MSDPYDAGTDRPDPPNPSTEPTVPLAPQPPAGDPTVPVAGPVAPAAYQPSPYAAPWPAYHPQPAVPAPGGSGRLPGWTWPLISGLALVLGVIGGVIGAGFIGGDGQAPGAGGGVLEVQRRTAPPLEADNGSIAAVAATVLPSTVQIIAAYDGQDRGATGSGFVFDKQGHIITNNHVIAEAAESDGPIEVIDHDGRHRTATVVGRSQVYDIAVLHVKGGKDLTPAAIGSSTQMRVGEVVVAFGSPLGLSATVTSGIVSAFDRPVTTGDGDDSSYINAVQTDAAINPGNSGGPLVNLQGQVIGVNSAIASLGAVSSDEGGNIGVGFAIPIEQVQITTDQILRTGEATYPVIGAEVRGTEEANGARVEKINAGSPASRSDLQEGDLITHVDDVPVTGSIDVVVAIRTHQAGETVTLTVERDGSSVEVDVALAGKVG